MLRNLTQLREAVEDRRAWHALVHRVTKSRTRLNNNMLRNDLAACNDKDTVPGTLGMPCTQPHEGCKPYRTRSICPNVPHESLALTNGTIGPKECSEVPNKDDCVTMGHKCLLSILGGGAHGSSGMLCADNTVVGILSLSWAGGRPVRLLMVAERCHLGLCQGC